MPDQDLSELADACGIERGYHDIWGVWHEAPPETVRALLSAMDMLGPSVKRRVRIPSQAAFPATVVLRRSGKGVPVRLPPGGGGKTLSWKVTLEQGQVDEGKDEIASLREAGHCGSRSTQACTVLIPLRNVPAGYHRLEVFKDGYPLGTALLIVTPDRCYLPAAAASGRRSWGISLQLYGLRSARNWGVGDFSDLADAVTQWAARGAAFVGVNPLHALYASVPSHASPYSPSSRLFLNPVYLDVEAIEDFAHCTAARTLCASSQFQATIDRLRSEELVDYPGVATTKKQVFELLHADFLAGKSIDAQRRQATFERFCHDAGEPLRLFALFEALHEHFRATDPAIGSWQQWPAAYREPNSAEVAQFAQERADRISYFLYLQWQCVSQLRTVAERCRTEKLEIGLYLDLAVSIDRGGADAWSNQSVYALGASVGAPPDEFNPAGQDWGLPPFNPSALQRSGYALFIQTLRANMAFAAALRIDHVMGLARLFWVPPASRAAKGAYVRYPLEDLLAIVALESERHRCMVVGEDLGTVPVQLRHALREWGVLSYRLLMFERDASGRFQRPSEYPSESMVAFSTHDLPTFAGYWRSQDAATRKALASALRHANLLPEGVVDADDLPANALASLSDAVHLYIARSPALLLSVQLDDLAGATEQANVPGTPDEAPNWRRKLPVSLEEMRVDPRYERQGAALSKARSTAGAPRPPAGPDEYP